MRRCLRSCGDQSGVPVARQARPIAVRSVVEVTPGLPLDRGRGLQAAERVDERRGRRRRYDGDPFLVRGHLHDTRDLHQRGLAVAERLDDLVRDTNRK